MLRDRCWIKSRIAARILLRRQAGTLQRRDYRLASELALDPGVSERLIDQALACLCAEKGLSEQHYHAVLRSTVAAQARVGLAGGPSD